jgi:hypothetical protein
MVDGTHSSAPNHRSSKCMKISSRNSSARLCRVFLITLVACAISGAGSLLAAGENETVTIVAKKYVAAHSQVLGFRVRVEKIEGDYARVKVTPKNADETDPAWVFLKREKGVWRGLIMGTYFTTEDYNEFRIPAGIQL